MTHSPTPCAIVHGTAIALCLAALVNGAAFWLKRTGLIDSAHYQHYLAYKSSLQITGRSDPAWSEVRRFQSRALVRLYSVNRVQALAKAAKYAAVAVLIGLCAWSWWRASGGRYLPAQPLFLVFAAAVLIALAQSWRYHNGAFLVPAVRTLGFLTLLSTAAAVVSTKNLRILSNYLILLLLLQLIMLPFELSWGLDIYTGSAFAYTPGDRAVGVFLQPASLGLFAAIALSAFLCFGDTPATMRLLAVCLSGVVVSASGSASAMLLWVLITGYALVSAAGLSGRARAGVLLLLATVVLAATPWLTARPDVMASLWGRVEKMQAVLDGAQSLDVWLFGQGLGVGSNAAFHWIRYAASVGTPVPALPAYAGSDSTPQTLLIQTGVAGCLAFYAFVGYAALRDREARPLLVILALASLFTNLLEFFPVDVLLALLLARSAAMRNRPLQRKTAGDSGGPTPGMR